MNTPKHTLGPWHLKKIVTESGTNHYWVTASNDNGWRDDRYMGVSGIMEEADALLITAAPDLLDALQCTLALAEAYYSSLPDGGPEQDHYMTAVIEPARAAIAKATGGAK